MMQSLLSTARHTVSTYQRLYDFGIINVQACWEAVVGKARNRVWLPEPRSSGSCRSKPENRPELAGELVPMEEKAEKSGAEGDKGKPGDFLTSKPGLCGRNICDPFLIFKERHRWRPSRDGSTGRTSVRGMVVRSTVAMHISCITNLKKSASNL